MLICGFTGLLVAYEGSVDPINAWSIAADRIGAILIGIGCVTMLGAVVFPRYASDALRDALSNMFRDLAGYAAAALRLSPSPACSPNCAAIWWQSHFLRRLCSSAMFEGRIGWPDEGACSASSINSWQCSRWRVACSFAATYSTGGRPAVDWRLRPALESIARGSRKPEPIRRTARPAQWRGDIARSPPRSRRHRSRDRGNGRRGPVRPLANGVLILSASATCCDGLAIVVVAEAASLGAKGSNIGSPRAPRDDFRGQREAMLVGVQAALAIGLLSVFWLATGWSEGFTAISGGAIMLFWRQPGQPLAVPRTFLIWRAPASSCYLT